MDIGGTRQLLGAAGQAGVAHFLYVSIVGVRHARVPCSRLKAAAEDLVRQSGVPYSIVPFDAVLLAARPDAGQDGAPSGLAAAHEAGDVARGRGRLRGVRGRVRRGRAGRRPAAFRRTGHHQLRRGRRAVPGSPGAPAPDPPCAAPPRRRPRGRRPHLPRRPPRHGDLGRMAEPAPARSRMRGAAAPESFSGAPLPIPAAPHQDHLAAPTSSHTRSPQNRESRDLIGTYFKSREYARFFARPPDVVAHDEEVMCQATQRGWLYIVRDCHSPRLRSPSPPGPGRRQEGQGRYRPGRRKTSRAGLTLPAATRPAGPSRTRRGWSPRLAETPELGDQRAVARWASCVTGG